MNKKAKRLISKCFNKHQTLTLEQGMFFYHGARSDKEIDRMRDNSMFSPELMIGVHYAFKRDNHDYHLNRALFCTRLKENTLVVVIKSINWNKFHKILTKYDDSIPLGDGFLQNEFVTCLKVKYGANICGAYMQHTNEYIFDSSYERLNVHRVIR